ARRAHGTNESPHRPRQPAQNIQLVDGLVDQRSPSFGRPASLDRPRIIRRRAIPLHVAVALQELPQTALRNGSCQKLAGIVETMLAHYAQLDARLPRHTE